MKWPRPRLGRGLLIALLALLFVDFCAVQFMQEPRRRGPWDPPQYGIRGTPGQFQLLGDSWAGMVGRVMLSTWHHNEPFFWAPSEKVLEVRVDVFPDDDSKATAADVVRLASQLADYRQETGEIAALLRAGGGRVTTQLPWGHVHNVVAGLLALGIIANAGAMIRARFIEARATRRAAAGLCASCGYPRADGVCPECGHSPQR